MREIHISEITRKVKQLFLKASYHIPSDVLAALESGKCKDKSPIGVAVLGQLCDNNYLAADESIPICQDTGVAILFIEYGQEVCTVGGTFHDAVNEGVRQAYSDGYLRKTVIYDPLFDRRNTRDNTPAIIHTKIVPGTQVKIDAIPRGFGGENMSQVKILVPADGLEGVKKFILRAVDEAGPNACPPVVVGVGIGGDLELACEYAKRATFRGCNSHNSNPEYANLEKELLAEINKLGIGAAGLGGTTTALAVNIEYYPTHIASIPVAVNICCHAARHASSII
ncbi:MAG: fumarate hydratase [Desulfovibrio sp.]|jgi:fumarate hydratase subunit alpha|nr:fumarate hydratase [Desulfovibrio sp.]